MNHKIQCTWKNKMQFDAEVDGHHITLDADANVGGENQGPKPKPLLLVALAGCTSMDVISILSKMKIQPEYYNVEIDGELTEEHPKYYKKIHITYQFKGKDLPLDKLERAVQLSQENYCGVSAQLKVSAVLTHEIVILK